MRTLKRLKRLQHDPLAPLVYVGLLCIVAFLVFLYNLISHGVI